MKSDQVRHPCPVQRTRRVLDYGDSGDSAADKKSVGLWRQCSGLEECMTVETVQQTRRVWYCGNSIAD